MAGTRRRSNAPALLTRLHDKIHGVLRTDLNAVFALHSSTRYNDSLGDDGAGLDDMLEQGVFPSAPVFLESAAALYHEVVACCDAAPPADAASAPAVRAVQRTCARVQGAVDRFSAMSCERALPLAINQYHIDLPPVYGAAVHGKHVARATAALVAIARGLCVKDAVHSLHQECSKVPAFQREGERDDV